MTTSSPSWRQPQNPTPATGNAPRSDFLKAEHLLEGKDTRALIEGPIRLVTGQKFGNQLVIGVVLETEKRCDYAIKIGGQQQIRLERRLGKDLTKWVNHEIALYRDAFDGQSGTVTYVAVRE